MVTSTQVRAAGPGRDAPPELQESQVRLVGYTKHFLEEADVDTLTTFARFYYSMFGTPMEMTVWKLGLACCMPTSTLDISSTEQCYITRIRNSLNSGIQHTGHPHLPGSSEASPG